MARPITLNAVSPYELPLDRATQSRIWKAFVAGGSLHSARASTLPYIIRRCEREGQPYKLTARPGEGYHIELA